MAKKMEELYLLVQDVYMDILGVMKTQIDWSC